jgi:hypothetical protein
VLRCVLWLLQACAFPAPPAVGDDLEVDHDDTLWHTRVLGVTPDGVYHVAEPGYIGTALEVGLEQLRPSLRWDWETGAWHRVQYPAGQEAPSPAGSASARAGPSGAGGAGKAPGAKEGGDAGSTTKGKGKKGASKPGAGHMLHASSRCYCTCRSWSVPGMRGLAQGMAAPVHCTSLPFGWP